MSTEHLVQMAAQGAARASADVSLPSGNGGAHEPDGTSDTKPAAGAPPRLRSVIEIVSLVVAPASLLSALLFYFGWTYTNARALYFGIDPSTFGYSTQDYLLRSVDPIFIPLGALLVAAVVIMHLHSALSRWTGDERKRTFLRVVAAVLMAGGCMTFVVGVIGVTRGSVFGVDFLLPPLGLCFGIGAIAYATLLNRRLAASRGASRRPSDDPRWLSSASRILLGLFIVLNLFWAVRDWADAVGRGRAQELAQAVPYRPGAVIYSKNELHIAAPGVEVTEVGDAESAYRFRYSGLSMLIYSGRKYFLVATQSPPESPTTIVLPDREDIRLEFTSRSLS